MHISIARAVAPIDSVAWAYLLAEDGHPAGVEFAGHSVTSNGLEAELGADPARAGRLLV